MSGIKLIVGLGNPGPEYVRTRHNAGFWFIDALNESCHGHWSLNSKLFGEVSKVELAGESVYLLQPATFMNLSGKSVVAALNFFKIAPEDCLLAHDDLDLEAGVARLKFDGGHGGQNGLRDTARLLGHGRFHRLRIGIGHPGDKNKVTAWVLRKAGADDERRILDAVDDARAVMPLLVAGDVNEATKKLNTRKT